MRTVAVIGHGLIGGSIARAAARAGGDRILTFDRDEPLGPAADADLIVLAAPVRENLRILEQLRPQLRPGTIVTDTGSTKAAIVAAGSGTRFVGGHPVAGAAASGRAAAREDLFDGRTWILTPGTDTSAHDVACVRAFVEALGATVATMAADEHDRIFAAVSHLPQLAASAIMYVAGTLAGGEGLRWAGQGLRDTTRLADSAPDIWLDVVDTNRANVLASLDLLIGTLQRLRDDTDGTALGSVFEHASQFRKTLLQQDVR